MKNINRGYIKVSIEFWNDKKLRKRVKRIMSIDHIVLDETLSAYNIIGRSRYFIKSRSEGEPLPQYDIIFSVQHKSILSFKYKKITFSVRLVNPNK